MLQLTFPEFLAYVGSTAVVAGGAAFGLFKFFAEKWLTAKFDARLAEYKHAQQKELEQLRFRINAMMDRAVKLHQREFDVLPELWGHLLKAHGLTKAFVSRFQERADLNGITGARLDEFLSKSSLADWEKTELRVAPDPSDYYAKRAFWHRLSDARSAYIEFNNYFHKSGIFIQAGLEKKFEELGKLMWSALLEREINEQTGYPHELHAAFDALSQRGEALIGEIRLEVRSRLWNSAG